MFRAKWFRALLVLLPVAFVIAAVLGQGPAAAQSGAEQAVATAQHTGGEANLVLPDLGQATFFGGTNGRSILMVGILVSFLGLAFGLMMYTQLKNMPVHASMLEISELIYATCKTYLLQQGKFLLILEMFIGSIIYRSERRSS